MVQLFMCLLPPGTTRRPHSPPKPRLNVCIHVPQCRGFHAPRKHLCQRALHALHPPTGARGRQGSTRCARAAGVAIRSPLRGCVGIAAACPPLSARCLHQPASQPASHPVLSLLSPPSHPPAGRATWPPAPPGCTACSGRSPPGTPRPRAPLPRPTGEPQKQSPGRAPGCEAQRDGAGNKDSCGKRHAWEERGGSSWANAGTPLRCTCPPPPPTSQPHHSCGRPPAPPAGAQGPAAG